MKLQVALLVLVCVAVATAKRNKRKGQGDCQYDKGDWSVCDESTNEMKRTLTLREAKEGCEATMEQTRPCKMRKQNDRKRCKYAKGEWGECDTTTNKVSRTLTLRVGEQGCEPTQTQTLACEKYTEILQRKEEKKARKEEMKADKAAFKEMSRKLKDLHRLGCRFNEVATECNQDTQKVTKTFTLESGDVTQCTMDPVEISCQMHDKMEKKKQRKQEMKLKRKEMKKQKKNKAEKKKDKKEKRKNRKNKRQG